MKALGSEVTTLVTFEGNPFYTAPGALKFADAAGKVTFIHAGVLPEETGVKAQAQGCSVYPAGGRAWLEEFRPVFLGVSQPQPPRWGKQGWRAG